MSSPNVLELRNVAINAPGGRPLIRDLSLILGRGERVALVGRNGVGKSTLIRTLAGLDAPASGRVTRVGSQHLVAQHADDISSESSPESRGERRSRLLQEAFRAEPDLLLLDEPSDGLDRVELATLVRHLSETTSALIVASHDPEVLRSFRDFFVMTESGCRLYRGDYDSLLADLVAENEAREEQYVRKLNQLSSAEKKSRSDLQRRTRKKHLGRVREVGRAPSRIKLNDKRSYAQEKQGKRAVRREARIKTERDSARATRRSLPVSLPLEIALPDLRPATGRPVIKLEDVTAHAGDRILFENVSLSVERDRLGVVGPNGSGKSTLLEIMVGERDPKQGRARQDLSRLGYVAQNSKNWCFEESVFDVLMTGGCVDSPETAIGCLRAHRFPLALASRPLASLSPGERVRAALLCLSQREPAVEVLLLDEPSDQLDILGRAALTRVLRQWSGGLVVVSHDERLLDELGLERRLELV